MVCVFWPLRMAGRNFFLNSNMGDMVSLGLARGDKIGKVIRPAGGLVRVVTERPAAERLAGRGRPISTPCGAPLETYNPGMFLLQGRSPVRNAGVAQLVEHDVANVVVVGSNPITRSWIAVSYRQSAVRPEKAILAASCTLSADRYSFLSPLSSCERSRATAAKHANYG